MARKKKSEEEPEENNELNGGNDDTFGLPEIEYEPLNRESASDEKREEEEPAPAPEPRAAYTQPEPETNANYMDRDDIRHSEYNETYYEEEEGSQWPKILGIVFLLLLVGAAVWYFGWKRPADEQAAELARQEEMRQDSIRQAEDRLANERRLASEREAALADSIANAETTPVVGTIETLNERTGRYYVVVASAIDGDLLMDFARKLSAQGVNAKIIPPYGNVKFHRLTVAEGDTFASAAQTAAELKGQYSEDLWVIRY